jgi:alpha/beta hydrolase fold
MSQQLSPQDPLGHELFGSGPTRVVVMNDWLCDTSTWDGARPLLDSARFTFAFADLRGYGRSRGRAGAFTIEEAAADVLALTTALGWTRFALLGHSMSSLIALHLWSAPNTVQRQTSSRRRQNAHTGNEERILLIRSVRTRHVHIEHACAGSARDPERLESP